MAPPKRGKEEKKPEEVTEEVGVFIFPDGSRYDGQYVKKIVAVEGSDEGKSTGADAGGGRGRRSSTPTQHVAISGDGSREVASAVSPTLAMVNGSPVSVVIYRHGNGVYVDGTTTFDGQWEHDRMHGFGKLTVASSSGESASSTYVGFFHNNEFSGRGVFSWPDGSKYDGQWRESKMHGEGCYWDAAGKKWKGKFFNGEGRRLCEVEENL